ncbi:MAG: hypothetical protein LBR93_07385 [Treponema sp.]|jgi:hypothetical protein|nr:hypothetical protein [Treponema sp.]
MSYLINFLLSNLIPIIIVVSVVLRIYRGLKSSADSRRGKAGPVLFREAEEQDETALEEDRDMGDDIQPRFYLAESAPPRQIPVQPPAPSLVPLSELKPLESASSGLIPKETAFHPEALQAEPWPALRQVPPSPAEIPPPVPAFFRRISALRPMQQALVFSEILGPPRGMASG